MRHIDPIAGRAAEPLGHRIGNQRFNIIATNPPQYLRKTLIDFIGMGLTQFQQARQNGPELTRWGGSRFIKPAKMGSATIGHHRIDCQHIVAHHAIAN